MILEKIGLDRKSFEALASESRVSILKALDENQKTVTDLSSELSMAKSTLFEHLTKMVDAGLIEKKESKNKWVYYRLTDKGRAILHPREKTKFFIVLASAIITLTGGVFGITKYLLGEKAALRKGVEETGLGLDPIYLFVGLSLLVLGCFFVYMILNKKYRGNHDEK